MRSDFRLFGIVISMIAIIILAFDFKMKIDNFNNIHQNTNHKLYKLKENIYERTYLINNAIINLTYNNDTFTKNYKDFKDLEKEMITDQKLQSFYPDVYSKLLKLFTQQKNVFDITDKFIEKNAKIKNSLSILYKRLNINYEEEYNEKFIKFLTLSLYQQSNITNKNNLKEELFRYFKINKDKNLDYKINFLHINILHKEIPKISNIINKIHENPSKKTLDDIFLSLRDEAVKQKESMTSKLYIITSGTILFFIIILFLARDIKRNLENLRSKDKLIYKQSKHAAMGEIIDAIAHQWKQPINIIKMRVDFLSYIKKREEDITKEDIIEFQDSVNEQLEHMGNTLDEFRDFLRPNKPTKLFSAKKSVDSVLVLLKDELVLYNINSKVDISKDITIKGIENEFKHVIINIINNAKEAFIQKNITPRSIHITIDSTKIYIQDNAGGIPTNIIGKIFEPNFTTKGDNKGTGIGLYMTRQILEKINISLDVENRDKGACFIIDVTKNLKYQHEETT